MPSFAANARRLTVFHAGLLVLLVAAAALRVVALVAMYPGLFFPDSNGFVRTAATGILNPLRVSGYSLFVWPFEQFASAGALIIVQHLVGLGIVVGLYAVLRRRGVSRPLAVAAAAPAALDGFILSVEHTIMSDTLYHAVLVGAIALLFWNERPGVLVVAAAGLLIGYAGITRSVGAPFAAIFVLYLVVRRAGWRQLLAFIGGWALVTGAYMAIFNAQHGRFALAGWGGHFLYARVATFADCSELEPLPPGQRQLCPDRYERLTTNGYLWNRKSPIRGLGTAHDARIGEFAMRVVKAQPREYADVVLADFFHYFEPGHRIGANDHIIEPWIFPRDPSGPEPHETYGPIRPPDSEPKRLMPGPYLEGFANTPRTDAEASQFLHGYQRFGYTSGQILAISALLVVAALVARRGPLRLRADAALVAALPLAGILLASALSQFSYRYGLIGPVMLPAAGALAITALRTPRPA